MRVDDTSRTNEMGLMLGLPATPRRMAGDILCTPREHDYAYMVVEKYLGSHMLNAVRRGEEDAVLVAERAWEHDRHLPYRRALCGLLETAERLGVELANDKVPDRASLADLALLARRRRCVIVIGHWRGSYLAPHHWMQPEDVERIRTKARQLADGLYKLDGPDSWAAASLIAGIDSADPVPAIRTAINGIIAAPNIRLYAPSPVEAAFEEACGVPIAIDLLNHYARNRDEIDQFFGVDVLSPGNRLELGSGFVTPSDLDWCFGDIPGVTIFVACHSIVLQARLPVKEQRRTWGRTDTLSPSGWLFVIKRTLERIASEGGDIMGTIDYFMAEVAAHSRGDHRN